MKCDDEQDIDHINRNDFQSRVEKFLDHSQFYLNRLSLLKNQLYDINRLNQEDLYIQKLNEIDTNIHNLAENILNIEQLNSQLNENECSKLDHQIHLLRNEIDREMNEFHRLRQQFIVSSSEENNSSINEIDKNDFEDNLTTNKLRQRHITTNRLNDSYDLLEQDLAHLREAVDEVATLVKQQQQQTLSTTEHLKNIAQYRIRNVSSFFQKTIQNRYVTLASGALLGASIGGPVGFMMGTKVGALVALSGSAVGALSMNIMRQRVTENDESQNENTTAYNQAML
ncbi:unnamed protein product [Rotaria sordida]|uniref:STX17-like N-terminal domain-containing protein n=1 Tax=Rotaria sordida TaxID=392033 RepID=A0A813U634_9BILA|nr:unnamed protein product [Rotaria sordida]CAF0968334.1 unnamed protein product [Rotaria sordida]CAF3642253.1 unnamed protein product [Rotaria sordida]CAF3747001.1 unnamed protein product [Rotaria sordida]